MLYECVCYVFWITINNKIPTHKTNNKLKKEIYTNTIKDKIEKEEQKNIVYEIQCKTCIEQHNKILWVNSTKVKHKDTIRLKKNALDWQTTVLKTT